MKKWLLKSLSMYSATSENMKTKLLTPDRPVDVIVFDDARASSFAAHPSNRNSEINSSFSYPSGILKTVRDSLVLPDRRGKNTNNNDVESAQHQNASNSSKANYYSSQSGAMRVEDIESERYVRFGDVTTKFISTSWSSFRLTSTDTTDSARSLSNDKVDDDDDKL